MMRTSARWFVDVAAIDRARILRGWTRRELGRNGTVDEGTCVISPLAPTANVRHTAGGLPGAGLVDRGRHSVHAPEVDASAGGTSGTNHAGGV